MSESKSNYVLDLLETKYLQYNQIGFIENDPICIPHMYTKKQDIEIAGFWAAILAWGQRKTIINKCKELFLLMDNAPHDFILNHTEDDLKAFENFKHRTFNYTDTLYFLHFFQKYYRQHNSLESAFVGNDKLDAINTESALIRFQKVFTDDAYFPTRTRKHIATPARNSTCKRLNMYLRWMVRRDNAGVDFGIWDNILPSQLVCPCDVHVDRVGRLLGLINRTKTDWKTAVQLTNSLKELSPTDPVKYDFALFGLGIEGFAN